MSDMIQLHSTLKQTVTEGEQFTESTQTLAKRELHTTQTQSIMESLQFCQMLQNTMWRVRVLVLIEKGMGVIWETVWRLEFAIVFQRTAGVFLY